MDPYAEQPGPQPPARRQHGCLWGCVGTLIAVAVVIVAVFGYGAWYFYHGFAADPRIQTIMTAVQTSEEARQVLGRNIKVLEVELHTFDYATGRGGTATYVLKLSGTDGEGELKADLDVSGNGPKITLMVLTGPDGRTHYLAGAPPPNPMIQNSI